MQTRFPPIHFFHRSLKAGFSINKVSQTIVKMFTNKKEFYCDIGRHCFRNNIFKVFQNRCKSGINHVTGDVHYCLLGLIGCKTVLTIHDTVSLDFHKHLTGWRRVFFEYCWYRFPLFLATKVVCISEETKKSVEKFTSRKDIVVIHNAVDDSLTACPLVKEPHMFRILAVGTSKNKNLLRTVRALKGVECVLSIVGPLDDDLVKELKENDVNYENYLGLDDAGIAMEYAKCDVVSFVTLFEGFGMPVVEANKVGRPVVCSDISVLKEVAGDAALFVNPYNVDEIHEAFLRLKNDRELVNRCVALGYKNVRRFDCKLIASKWADLYSSMLNISKEEFFSHYCSSCLNYDEFK